MRLAFKREQRIYNYQDIEEFNNHNEKVQLLGWRLIKHYIDVYLPGNFTYSAIYEKEYEY